MPVIKKIPYAVVLELVLNKKKTIMFWKFDKVHGHFKGAYINVQYVKMCQQNKYIHYTPANQNFDRAEEKPY